MYNLICSTYQNKLLKGFSDVELELFKYIINSTPEVMLAYKDEDNKLQLNHGYIVLLALLTKALGPSRELILNTAHAKDLQRLYELADDTNSNSPEHLKGPSFKLLQLLAGDIWPDILELFTSEEEARSALYGKIDLVEAMVPIIRKRGSLDSLMTILNSYIPHSGLAADEDKPMKAYIKLNNENDLYGNKQLYKLLLHAKPTGYKIELLSREYPFYETASPALITNSANPVMPWISNMSNGIYPYFGSPLQTPEITYVRVAGGALGPATLAVTFKNKHFEPLKATISAKGTYEIGSKTYNVDLTPAVYTISDRIPSPEPQNVHRTINNSFPVNIKITEVTVTIEPHNSGIPGDSRLASETIYTSSRGIILAPTPSPVVQPTITDIELDKNLFTASISITNNDPAALSGTLAVKGNNSYKVEFFNLLPGETQKLTITHPELYLIEELLLEVARDNGVGPVLTYSINVAPYVPADLSSLPRLKTPTPEIRSMPYSDVWEGKDYLDIIAKNTDPSLPVRCYGTIFVYLSGDLAYTYEYDVEIPAGDFNFHLLYRVPRLFPSQGAIAKFDLTAKCAVYTGNPAESIKEPVTYHYTTDFILQRDLYPDPVPPTASQENAYLTFQSNSPFTLEVYDNAKHWDGTLYYSTDLETWHEWDGTTIRSSVDNKLYLRGTENTRITGGSSQNYRWVLEGSNIKCIGNIENLLDWEAVESGSHPSMASYCYAHLFRGCAALVSPPALPATTLTSSCYYSMFRDCTALTSVPALPATTLTHSCYYNMFSGCTSLKVSSDPTETYQYAWRIPTSRTGTTATNWNLDMLSGIGETPTSDPDINKTYYVENPPVSEPNHTYLTFQSNSPFTLEVANSTKNWNGTLYYSTNLKTWSVWDGTAPLSSVNNKLYLSGARNTRITGNNQNYRWVLTGSNIECTGNIENLLDWETVASGNHPSMTSSCYAYLFYGCAALVSAPALPATTLADYCYYYMFSGCTALTSAPALPATTLADRCYLSMFSGCTSLTSAPALPATTLADYCYYFMFSGCTALTSAPALPATALADSCYESMFYGCTALTSAPALPATTLATSCYNSMFRGCTALTSAPALPATTLANNCYQSMFQGCTALASAPALPATTLVGYCYRSMFSGCTALVSAPALPATTLADSCYLGMFSGCTSLTSAPALLPATTLAGHCYYFMFYGCTALTSAPALPATTLADYCYEYMFSGCTALISAPALPATTLASYCYAHMFRGCASLTLAPALPATTLAIGCYQSMFQGCTSLTSVPALPATTLVDGCYYCMFWGCASLKISDTKTGTYQHSWRIPTSGTGTTATSWNSNMLSGTDGTFTGDPEINKTYYVENPPVV